MIIQWYPGHMNKALKIMEKDIKIVDAIIYVLDARAPFACLNPKFDKIIIPVFSTAYKIMLKKLLKFVV
mgnify:CR=1 FL=1